MNITELEKTNRIFCEQEAYWGDGKPKPVPVFTVSWGVDPKWPKVSVRIDGRTKTLIHLRQEDDSFSRRPKALAKDLEKLAAIPDAEFTAYTAEQRGDLVRRFAVVQYTHTRSNAPFVKSHTEGLPRSEQEKVAERLSEHPSR